MKNKLHVVFLLASLVGLGAGYVLTNSYELGLCASDAAVNTFDTVCHQFYESIGDPVFYGMGALSIVFLILFFRPQAFGAWKKFAIWFIPLATLAFIFAPEPSGWVSPIPAPEQFFQWVSALYVVVSLFIIGWVGFVKRR